MQGAPIPDLASELPLPRTPEGCYHPAFAAREKGDRPHLSGRPEGCFAQTGPVPLFPLVANKDVYLRKEALLLMQSSAAVAGRALIMLACVVGIPAVALSGTSWSDMLKKLQDFRWPTILDLASASSTTSGPASGDEAPRFTPSTATGTPAAGGGPVQPVQTTAPAAFGPMPASAVIPAGYQVPAESAPIQPPAATGGDENARAGSISTADPFHCIQDRLRQLGATYYLLESWGNQQQMYRFYCKMAVGGSAAYTRCFEATNSNPLQAMRQVLQQVETQRWEVAN